MPKLISVTEDKWQEMRVKKKEEQLIKVPW